MEPRDQGGAPEGEREGSGPTPAAPVADAAPPAPPVRKSGLLFFLLLLVLFLPGMLAQSIHVGLGLLWTQLFAFLLPAFVVSSGSNLAPRAFLRLAPVRPRLLGLGVLAGLGGYVLAVGVMGLGRELLPERWVRLFDVGRVFEGGLVTRVAVAAVAALVAPVCEEIAFRGYLQTALGTRLRPAAAVAGSTLLFALLHLDPVRFPALLVLGGVFGWLAWRAGSVWPAVAAHGANNALVSAFVLAGVAGPDAADVPADAAVRVRGALVAVALGAAILWPLLRAFDGAAREAPPQPGPIARRDPAVASTRFSARRLPAALHAAILTGLWTLVALGLAGAAGWLGPRRG